MSVKSFPFLTETDEYYFDGLAVERVVDFIERFCKLTDPMGQPFKLLPWEKQIATDIFGWKRKDNNERRFSSVYIEVPRKQGKSFFVAALSLYCLMADGVDNPEVYVAAANNEQSRIIYRSVLAMLNQSKFFVDRLTPLPYRSEVIYQKKNGLLKALSGEGVGSHGKYPSAVICDELHEWTSPKSEYLYEALTSGFGNRKSPLTIHITTAGYGSQPTLAKRMHEKAMRFAEGQLEDPTFYGVVYGASQDDDWTSETVWQSANPSWELAKKNLNREFLTAKTEPSKQNTFKRLYLNIWTQQQTRWLDMTKWDNCSAEISLDDFNDKDVILGVDLSQTYDLTAITLLARNDNGSWFTLTRCYMPRRQIERRSREDNIPYDQWEQSGYLLATDGVSNGTTIDYEYVVADILDLSKRFNIVAVGYDPAGAPMVIPKWEEQGLNCVPIYQRHNDLSQGTKEIERRLTSGEISIALNPCVRWQAGNTEVEYRGDQIKPVKPNMKGSYGGTAKYKVDAITSLVIASQTMLLTYSGLGKEKEATEYRPQAIFVNR